MKRQTVLILLLTVFVHFCKGQNTSAPIKNSIPETKANAPTRIVRSFIQDRKGNIWIATHEGVFRYDGKLFTNVTREIAPPRVGDGPENRFYAVLEDKDGKFWFGSTDSGVYSYDGKSFRHFTTADGLPSDRIHTIYQDGPGNIWFGSMNGVSRYDGKSFRNFTTEDGLPSNDVMVITGDQSGKLWLGTRAGVCTYDGLAFVNMTNDSGHGFGGVSSIIGDKKGNMWIGGTTGLWRYDGTTFASFSTISSSKMIVDEKGNIWICSQREDGRGWALFRWDTQSDFSERTMVAVPSDSGLPILSVFRDSDGLIWFGAHGIYRYDGNTITQFVP